MIQKIFRELFNDEPTVVRSPGRVNLMGEHTHYNEGWVLAAAINLYAEVAVSKRADGRISLSSLQYQEGCQLDPGEIRPVKGDWTNPVLSVLDRLLAKEQAIGGFNMVINNEVPAGVGMSSTVAVINGVCAALNALFRLGLSRFGMMLMGQAAAEVFAGTKCDAMKNYPNIYGRQGHALKMDCRKRDFEYIPLRLDGYKIVLLHTDGRHDGAATLYNRRKRDCRQALSELRQSQPEHMSLRDTSLASLQQITNTTLRKRCAYIVKENTRLQAACTHLQAGDAPAFGEQLFQSHEGLCEEYEVSSWEQDWLVYALTPHPAVMGARMLCGSSGIATINIIRETELAETLQELGRSFERLKGGRLSVHIMEAVGGTTLVNKKILQ